jgi:hypothetical protein
MCHVLPSTRPTGRKATGSTFRCTHTHACVFCSLSRSKQCSAACARAMVTRCMGDTKSTRGTGACISNLPSGFARIPARLFHRARARKADTTWTPPQCVRCRHLQQPAPARRFWLLGAHVAAQGWRKRKREYLFHIFAASPWLRSPAAALLRRLSTLFSAGLWDRAMPPLPQKTQVGLLITAGPLAFPSLG